MVREFSKVDTRLTADVMWSLVETIISSAVYAGMEAGDLALEMKEYFDKSELLTS